MSEQQTTILTIGTKKGLWLARSTDRVSWTVSEPQFLMEEIPSVAVDTRGGSTRIFAGRMSWHFGPCISTSDDLGATWSEPRDGSFRFGPDDGAALERVWQIQPDAEHRPGVVWAGCQPISVWKSTDHGETFELNRGLWDHPHRGEWGEGFGGAAAHTVLPSPADDTVHVAMSTGGVYRSDDGGTSWQPRNSGISAPFMPEPPPEFGQCVHKVARDAVDPDRLFAQNHHGVYTSADRGDTWQSIADGLPADFGFVMLTHPHRGGTAWVIPLTADGERIPPDGRLRVHRTDDDGATWHASEAGLPDADYNSVLRDAACVDTAEVTGVYFGTRGGSVYASADEGRTFSEVVGHLPDVLSVRAAVVPS